MFGKIIDLIVKWICGSSQEKKNRSGKVSFEREPGLNVNAGGPPSAEHPHLEGMKKDERAGAKKYHGLFGAFHYMNTRAEKANFGSSVTHEWVRGISLKVKDFFFEADNVGVAFCAASFVYGFAKGGGSCAFSCGSGGGCACCAIIFAGVYRA